MTVLEMNQIHKMKKPEILNIELELQKVQNFLCCLSNAAPGIVWKLEYCEQAEELEKVVIKAREDLLLYYYDPEQETEPNQSLQPTTMLVTDAAAQPPRQARSRLS
jgi:hypothetical protein